MFVRRSNESQVTFNAGTDGNTIYIANMVFLRLFAVGLARFGAKVATQITMKFQARDRNS